MSGKDVSGGSADGAAPEEKRGARWVGSPMPRKEDEALLTGRARFIDDLEPVGGLKHAAILRSPHAHARIVSIDTSRALALPAVHGVVTGAEVAEATRPIASVVKTPMSYYPIAVEKVRYVGEPVAVVVADDRYQAEDALEAIDVVYEPLPPVVDVEAAMADDAAQLHEAMGSNIATRRHHVYGDPDAAFAAAKHRVSLDYKFPRYASTPIETSGVVAHHEAAPDRYTVWSNFQGPFALHPLMSGALGVPGNRLRLITPQASGGSFGIKQSVFAYIVLLCTVSRKLGVPVKWIEDRLEHLAGSSAAGDRAGSVEGAFSAEGELTGLRFRNLCNMGAYVRPPEPASVYRMQATANACYRVRDIEIENVLVVTNKTPIGLNRGYGGPQFFFALERLMDLAAKKLGIDPAELRRRNFIDKAEFPYTCAGGSILDSGDYQGSMDELLRLAGYEALLAKRDDARKAGRKFGIGFAAGLEPSGSNMAYVNLAQAPEQRAKGGRKSGANASAVIAIDPTGTVTVRLCSTPNGQGHATVTAQIVADALGIEPDAVDVVTEIDTLTSAWSIASGNYSNRFAAAVTTAVSMGAEKVANKLKRLAAETFECDPADVELVGGQARIVGVPDKALPIKRVAAATHWDPAGLPEGMEPGLVETAIFSPPTLDAPDDEDRVPSSVTYGSVMDLAAVEVDPATGEVQVDRYVSVHDVGTMLNPLIVEGQILGGFAHGFGGAMLEELAYDHGGNFLSGTFADYLCPTAPELPEVTVGHVTTPSPKTALGAKGLGDGSSMLAPVALANAVGDALDIETVVLPLTLHRVWQMARGRTPEAVASVGARAEGPGIAGEGDMLVGDGEIVIAADRATVWRLILDPDSLSALVPGCKTLSMTAADVYAATVSIGAGPVRGTFQAKIELRDKVPEQSLRMLGSAEGQLGFGSGEGSVRLADLGGGQTKLSYRYRAKVGGKVATVGQRMLGTATRLLIGQFFANLNRSVAPGGGPGSGGEARPSWWQRILGGGDR